MRDDRQVFEIACRVVNLNTGTPMKDLTAAGRVPTKAGPGRKMVSAIVTGCAGLGLRRLATVWNREHNSIHMDVTRLNNMRSDPELDLQCRILATQYLAVLRFSKQPVATRQVRIAFDLTAACFQTDPDLLHGGKRSANIRAARCVACHLAHKSGKVAQSVIARYAGYADHSTVDYYIRDAAKSVRAGGHPTLKVMTGLYEMCLRYAPQAAPIKFEPLKALPAAPKPCAASAPLPPVELTPPIALGAEAIYGVLYLREMKYSDDYIAGRLNLPSASLVEGVIAKGPRVKLKAFAGFDRRGAAPRDKGAEVA